MRLVLKAKAKPVGSVSQWRSGPAKKEAPGKWRRLPKDYKGKLSPELVEKAIAAGEKILHLTGNLSEIAAVYSADGKELLFKDGGPSSVTFNNLEFADIQSAEVLVHNHPNGSSFSSPDIGFLYSSGIKEMWAVSEDKRATFRPDFTSERFKNDFLLYARDVAAQVPRLSKLGPLNTMRDQEIAEIIVPQMNRAERSAVVQYMHSVSVIEFEEELDTLVQQVKEGKLSKLDVDFIYTDRLMHSWVRKYGGDYQVVGKLKKALTPVDRVVHRRGKTFIQRYWVKTKKDVEEAQERELQKVAEGEAEVRSYDAIALAKGEQLIDYAPDETTALKRALAMKQQYYGDAEPDIEEIRETAARELEYAMQASDTGQDWYSESIKRTRAVLMQRFPELASDTQWGLFTAMLAFLSPNQSVKRNMQFAVFLWEDYKELGRIPLTQKDGTGWPSPNAKDTLGRLQKVIDSEGEAGAVAWLLAPVSGRELKELNPSVEDVVVDGTYPRVRAWGAKVGAFYSNLMGDFTIATVDMWMTRSWRRWTNTLKAVIKKQRDKKTGEVVAKEILADRPSATDRRNIQSLLESLGEEFGLSVAELQAVFWYYEKRLWEIQGIVADAEDIDYEQAARAALEVDREQYERESSERKRKKADAVRKASEVYGVGRSAKTVLRKTGWPAKTHMKFQSLPITIENPKGSIRSGKDWQTFMHHEYGYIRGTMGVDGDQVDVYIGPSVHSDLVFIINQKNPETGKFDEQKVMLGFKNAELAKEAYLSQYDDPRFFESMKVMTMEEFKLSLKKQPKLIKSDDHKNGTLFCNGKKWLCKHGNKWSDFEWLGDNPFEKTTKRVKTRVEKSGVYLLILTKSTDEPVKRYYSPDEIKARGMRWVTIRGAKVLLQSSGDGWVVVGGAGGKLSHMKIDKILPKEEYERRRKERLIAAEETGEERAVERETGEIIPFERRRRIKTDEEKREAQRVKQIREKRQEMKRHYLDRIMEITKAGSISEFVGDTYAKQIEERVREDIESKSKEKREAAEREGKEFDLEKMKLSIKRKTEQEMVKAAFRKVRDLEAQAMNAVAKDFLGEYEDTVTKVVGEQVVTESISTVDDAYEIVKAHKKMKELVRELKKKNVDTDALKVGESLAGDIEIDEAALRQEIEQSIETAKNIAFYDEINPHMDKISKYMDNGASRALNGALSELYEGGSFFNEDLVRELGIEAVGRAIAQKLHDDGKAKVALEALRRFSDTIREKTVDRAMNAAKTAYRDRDRILENATGEEPLYTEVQGRAMAIRHLALAYNELGSAAGSLRAMAHLINALEDPPNERLSIDLGPNQEKAIRRMERSGFNRSKFKITMGADKHFHAEFDSKDLVPFFEKNRQQLESDERLDAIKRHQMNDGSQAPGMRSKWGFNPATKKFEDDIAKAQEASYRFAKETPKALLAASAGIGKTYIAANLLSDAMINQKAKKILVVVPANLKQQTVDDGFKKFLPPEIAEQVKWADEKMSPADRRAMYDSMGIHVVSHNALQNDAEWLQKQNFDMVIADEVHDLINAKEGGESTTAGVPGSKSFDSLTKIGKKTPRFVAMTGTPIKTNKSEIYKIAAMMGANEQLGTLKEFEKRHKDINQSSNAFVASEIDAFRKEIAPFTYEQHYTLGVKKKTRRVSIKSSTEQRKEYKKIMGAHREAQEKKVQGASSTRDVDLWKASNLGGGKNNPKLQRLVQELDTLPVGDKALVFLSQGPTVDASKQYANQINEVKGMTGIEKTPRGKVIVDHRYAVDISSDTKRSDVKMMKAAINGNPEAMKIYPNLKVIVATNALATGHNITGATTVFKVDTPLSQAQDDQQSARSYRNGQTRDVEVVYFEGDDPNDINKRYNLRKKGRESELVGNPSSVGLTGDDSGFGAHLRQVEMDQQGVKNEQATLQRGAA